MDLSTFFSAATWSVARPWFVAALLIAGGFVLSRALGAISGRLTRRAGSQHLAAVAQRLVFYTGLLLALFGALNVLGIEPAALLTTAGLLTVAIGFAAQTSVANVISGIFLLIDRPFSINDTVMVDGMQGVVTGIDLLSTKIRTFENLVVRFPNEAMLKATITNYTQHSVRRVEQRVTVAYSANIDHVIDVIERAVIADRLLLDEPEATILVESLGDNGVVMLVRGWCVREDFIFARSSLAQSLKEALQDAGVEIPFPQRVVHTPASDQGVSAP